MNTDNMSWTREVFKPGEKDNFTHEQVEQMSKAIMQTIKMTIKNMLTMTITTKGIAKTEIKIDGDILTENNPSSSLIWTEQERKVMFDYHFKMVDVALKNRAEMLGHAVSLFDLKGLIKLI